MERVLVIWDTGGICTEVFIVSPTWVYESSFPLLGGGAHTSMFTKWIRKQTTEVEDVSIFHDFLLVPG